MQAGTAMKIPLEIPLPNEEGVYDVVIAAVNNPHWSQAVRQPLNWKRTIAERRVQLLVLGPQRPPGARADREFTQVVEIDPANPRWFEKLNKLPQLSLTRARLPRLWKGPLGNDCFQTRPHAAGRVGAAQPERQLARRELAGLLAADQLSPAGRTFWRWTIPATSRRRWASASSSPTPPGR